MLIKNDLSLVGIKKPVNILQRTCTVEDVINTLVLTVKCVKSLCL